MRRSRFSVAQRRRAVSAAADGIPIAQICADFGISQATFFRWKASLRASDARIDQELTDLRAEVHLLRSRLRRYEIELAALRDILSGKD